MYIAVVAFGEALQGGALGWLDGRGAKHGQVRRRIAGAVRRQSGMVHPAWGSGGKGRLCRGAGRFLFLLTRLAHGKVGIGIGEQCLSNGSQL